MTSARKPDARSISGPLGPPFRRIAIIGVGLIGGSLARALRAGGHPAELVGHGRNPRSLQRAVELGVIDRFVPTLGEAVGGADLVVVAVPVGSIPPVLEGLRPHLAPGTVITDVGSTKAELVAAARRVLGGAFPRFVPGHPIAGDERSGVEAATIDLFRGRSVILTPTPETDPEALDRVRALWAFVGARVRSMGAEEHDRVLAATSHLPHVLAFALVEALARMDESEEIFRYAAGGFRDFTRIASSDAVMWRDICLANGPELRRALEAFSDCLGDVDEMIRLGDGARLAALFERARSVRDRNVVDPVGSDGELS